MHTYKRRDFPARLSFQIGVNNTKARSFENVELVLSTKFKK